MAIAPLLFDPPQLTPQTFPSPNLRGFRKWKAKPGDQVTVPWPILDGSPGFFDRGGVCVSRSRDGEGSEYWIVRWNDRGELSTPIWDGDAVVVVKTAKQIEKERKTKEKMAGRVGVVSPDLTP